MMYMYKDRVYIQPVVQNQIYNTYCYVLTVQWAFYKEMDTKLQVLKVQITLKALQGLTDICTDAFPLEDINKKLECVTTDMRSALPAADGLVVCHAIKERIK